MNFDGVADPHAQERTGHFAVEGPVAERGAFREPAFELDADQIDAHGLRVALADGRRQIGRVARDVRLDNVCAGGFGVTTNLPFMPAS